MLFGRKSCKEDRRWEVRAHFIDDSVVLLTQQLNEEEAQDFYDELIEELQKSKSDWIEVKTDMGEDYHPDTRLLNKRNIKLIKLTTED